tara:strand:- start:263 stop:2464 length:2202 start_codon:yes stop_codon:yes gene_type:complete
MSIIKEKYFVVLCSTLLFPQIISASITATIRDSITGNPVPDAIISIDGTWNGLVSDKHGRFRVEPITLQKKISITAFGYRSETFSINQSENDSANLNIYIKALPFLQDQTIVSATGIIKSTQNVTVPVDVISRSIIERSGAANVGGLLRNVAGLSVHRSLYGYLGSPTGVMIQGLDPKRTLILIDGEKIIGGPGGVIDLSQIPISDINRIEVIKGPHSALYGSEAMGGVIHVITRNPSEKSQQKIKIQNGSDNRRELNLSLQQSIGKSKTIVSAIYTRHKALDLEPDDPDTDLDSFIRKLISGTFEFEPIRNTKISVSSRWLKQNEKGTSSQYFAPLNKTYIWHFPDRTIRKNTKINIKHGADLNRPLIEIVTSKQTLDDQSIEDLEGSLESRNRITENTLEKVILRANKEIASNQYFTIGIQRENENLFIRLDKTKPLGNQTTTVEVPESNIVSNDIFAQTEWQLTPSATMIFGLRYQIHSNYPTEFVPKISAKYRIGRSFGIRGSISKGYRTPSLKERFYVFDHSNLGYMVKGNKNLSPEKSIGINIGANYKLSNKTSYSCNLFNNNLQNLIQTQYDPTQSSGRLAIYTYDNVGKATTRGIESKFSYSYSENLSLAFTHTYLKAFAGENSNELPGRPTHSIKLSTFYKPTTTTDFQLRINRESKIWSDTSLEQRSPAQIQIDISIQKRIDDQANLFVEIRNILNERRDLQIIGDLRPIRGRMIDLGLSISL